MSIPDTAIEAAAETRGEHRIQTEPSMPGYRFAYCVCRWRSPDVLSDEAARLGFIHEATAAIEAAMPAIREHIANELHAALCTDPNCEDVCVGAANAVEVVLEGFEL